MVLSETGELYLWPFETKNREKRSIPSLILPEIKVSEVSLGFNFALILASSGLVFSLGSN